LSGISAGMEKAKRIEHKSYWQDFYKKNPDPTYFRKIIAQDSILKKIFNFASVPPIFHGIMIYPFEEKIIELKTISKEDENYLLDKVIRGGSDTELYGYLVNLLGTVKSTITIKQLLDERIHYGWSEEQILSELSETFRFISLNQTIKIEYVNGNKETIIRKGRFYPLGIETYERYNRNTSAKNVGLNIYFPKFMEEERVQKLIEIFKWDHFSVESYKQYRDIPGITEICFLSDQNDCITIQYYHHGKPLLEEPFQFQIAKKYSPLILKTIGTLSDTIKGELTKYEPKVDIKRAIILTEAYERLRKAIFNYDDKTYEKPGSYFKVCFDHWEHELYEKFSSEAGNVECDPFCKFSKESKEIPCKYETTMGYCKDPKRKRRLKSKIKQFDGSIDDLVDPNDEEKRRRIDHIKGDVSDPELALLNKEIMKTEEELFDIVEKDERLMRILSSEDRRSGADQKYYNRKVYELKEMFAKKK